MWNILAEILIAVNYERIQNKQKYGISFSFFSVSANVWKKKNVFMDFSPIPLAHDVNVWTSFREKERRERVHDFICSSNFTFIYNRPWHLSPRRLRKKYTLNILFHCNNFYLWEQIIKNSTIHMWTTDGKYIQI